MSETPTNELLPALECLIAGRASLDDIQLLRQALAGGQITFANKGGIAIGRDVSHSVVLTITGNNNTVSLSEDVLRRLISSQAPHQAPALPEHFVPRPEYSEALLDLLLSPGEHLPGTLMVSAVHGLGGIGKTTLIAAIAHDLRLQARFPNGVLWVTLGQKPELLSILGGWIRALGDHKYHPIAVDEASMQVKTLLYDKACLLVIDDVWDAEHVQPFRVGNERCPVIITTRDATLVRKIGARLFDLDVMSAAQAQALFEARLGKLDKNHNTAMALAKKLGYLPLALELATAQVEDGRKWEDLLAAFQQGLADLHVLDLDDAKFRNESLRLSFHMSLEQLNLSEQTSFSWLGVLPEDAMLTPRMAATLWELPIDEARKRLHRFRNKALLKTVGEECYTVHDLLHDEAKLHLAKQMPIPQAHATLLERYRSLCLHPSLGSGDGGKWHTIPDDGYIHAHLTWHMEQAGQTESIFALLEEETKNGRNGWYTTCERNGQLVVYLDDLRRAWNIISNTLIEGVDPGRSLAIETHLALSHASLVSQSANYPPELLAKAVKYKLITPGHALIIAGQKSDHAQKAETLVTLAPEIPSDLHSTLLSMALAITSDRSRMDALVGLVPSLSIELRNKALYSALVAAKAFSDKEESRYEKSLVWGKEESKDEKSLVRVLTSLTPYLSVEFASQALDLVQTIREERVRMAVLTDLAIHLPTELLSSTMAVVQNLREDSTQVRALSDLAPHLSPELLHIAFQTAVAIVNSSMRVEALTGLASHLSLELLLAAFSAIQTFKEKDNQARALISLIPYLPTKLRTQATAKSLDAIREIRDDGERISVVATLVPYLSVKQRTTTLNIIMESARSIYEKDRVQAEVAAKRDEKTREDAISGNVPILPVKILSSDQAAAQAKRDGKGESLAQPGLGRPLAGSYIKLSNALISIAPYTPVKYFPDIFEMAQSIGYEYIRAATLYGLTPYLPFELLLAARDAAYIIRDEKNRAEVLMGIASRMPAQLRSLAMSNSLEATLAIPDEGSRVDLLIELTPRLPAELLPNVVDAIRVIRDEGSRADALINLAPYLPAELLVIVLEIAQAIAEKGSQVRTLLGLVPNLPVELQSVVLEILKNSSDGRGRAALLLSLIPCLSADLGTTALACALESVQAICDEESQVDALINLALHLEDEPRTRALSTALDAAQIIRDTEKRAKKLTQLIPYLPASLLSAAFEAVRTIGDEMFLAMPLIALAPRLPIELLNAAFEMTQTIRDEERRTAVLIELAPRCLSTELLSPVLDEVRAIRKEGTRVNALASLVPYLPVGLLPTALDLVKAVDEEGNRARALTDLAPYLPAELLPAALTMALAIREGGRRAAALIRLAPHLPADLLSRALAAVKDIGEEGLAWALTGLIPYLSTGLLLTTLNLVPNIRDENIRTAVLTSLARHLPPELCPIALQAIKNLSKEWSRVRVLVALVPHMPTDLLPSALAMAQSIHEENVRADALAGLALYLPPSLLPAALADAQSICNVESRAIALAGLVPHLPDDLRLTTLSVVLETVQTISEGRIRAAVLSDLMPYLTNELLLIALDAAQAIQEDGSRAVVLVGLVPRLPVEMRTAIAINAHKSIQAIWDSKSRAEALTVLAPYLPADLLPPTPTEAWISSIEARQIDMPYILSTARDIKDDGERVNELANILPGLHDWAELHPIAGMGVWRDLVGTLANLPRREFLGRTGQIVPYTLSFLPQTQHHSYLAGTLNSIVSVSRWWR